MWLRTVRWAAFLGFVPLLYGSVPKPADWAPARWPWTEPKSLELLAGSPINCLLLKSWPAEFVAAADGRGLATLAILTPGPDVVAAARQALASKVTGIVLQGDFPEGASPAVREAAGGAPVIELTSRSRMPLGSNAPVIGTWQGVWPGIAPQDDRRHAGPTDTAWIDTNTGFIRTARAWGKATLWIANEPPEKTIVTGARYLQVIADAAFSGARWVVAFDRDFAARLHGREAGAMKDWERMNQMLAWFEHHPEWREMQEFGQLAVVQDPARGALLSGGIIDMIAVKHTPVRPVPRGRVSPEALAGATVAVNVDPDSLPAEQKDVLRGFTRGGGTLFTPPPGYQDPGSKAGNITLEKAEINRLSGIWREVNNMIGRRNLGVRLFNVASMLSHAVVSADGKTMVLELVNYSDYPVENVTAHFLGNYKHATLLTPEGAEKPLELYKTDEGEGVDIDKVSVCAAIRLEQ